MNKTNYLKLFFTIFFSVTLAVLASGTIFKYWFAHEASMLVQQATKSIEAAEEEINFKKLIQHHIAEQKRIRLLSVENAKKEEQKRGEMAERVREVRTDQTQQENCLFWEEKYSKTQGSYEKQMMSDACE